MIDNRKLRYFVTVVEFGSFTKAADALHITQPALSRQVKQLEEELGVELLLREGRGIRITDAGEALLLHARTIARDFERLREDMQARSGEPTGRVVFGIPPTLADTLVPRLVEATRHKFPLVTLKVAEGLTPVLLGWLRSSDADLAIVSLAHPDDAGKIAGVALEAVANEDMVVVEKGGTPAPPRVYERAALSEKPIVVSQMLADIVRRQLGALYLPLNIVTEIELGAGGKDHGAARTGRDHPAGLHAGRRARRRRGRGQRHHGDAGPPHAGARRAELPPPHLGRRGGAPPRPGDRRAHGGGGHVLA